MKSRETKSGIDIIVIHGCEAQGKYQHLYINSFMAEVPTI